MVKSGKKCISLKINCDFDVKHPPSADGAIGGGSFRRWSPAAENESLDMGLGPL